MERGDRDGRSDASGRRDEPVQRLKRGETRRDRTEREKQPGDRGRSPVGVRYASRVGPHTSGAKGSPPLTCNMHLCGSPIRPHMEPIGGYPVVPLGGYLGCKMMTTVPILMGEENTAGMLIGYRRASRCSSVGHELNEQVGRAVGGPPPQTRVARSRRRTPGVSTVDGAVISPGSVSVSAVRGCLTGIIVYRYILHEH